MPCCPLAVIKQGADIKGALIRKNSTRSLFVLRSILDMEEGLWVMVDGRGEWEGG